MEYYSAVKRDTYYHTHNQNASHGYYAERKIPDTEEYLL